MKKKIPFDKLKAELLKNQHNIKPATIKTWKHRGEMPDPEFYEQRKQVKPETQSRILEKLETDWINISRLEQKAQLIFDVRAGDYTMSVAQAASINKDLLSIKNILKAFVSNPNDSTLKKIILDKRIKHFVIFKGHKKAIDRFQKGMFVREDEYREMKGIVKVEVSKI